MGCLVGDGQEAGFLHKLLVGALRTFNPLLVFRTRHEALIEGALFHELLPLGRLPHAFEEIDIIGIVTGATRKCIGARIAGQNVVEALPIRFSIPS